ncbi:MAG TPA: hypothetical protein VF707_21045 [Ardenticatenaceae bacterium]
MSRVHRTIAALVLLLTSFLAACQPSDTPPSVAVEEAVIAVQVTATALAPTGTPTLPPTATPTRTPTRTPTPSPSATATLTPTPTPQLDLQPATLDASNAAEFIAGVEFTDPARFQGRVYEDRTTGATILLSQALYEMVTLGAENPAPEAIADALEKSEWAQLFDLHTNPARRDRTQPPLRFRYDEMVVWEPEGVIYAWNYDNFSRNHRVYRLLPEGRRQQFQSGMTVRGTRNRPLVEWAEGLGLVLTNGWQATHQYDPQTAQFGELETPAAITSVPAQQAAIVAELLAEVPGNFNSRPYAFNGYITAAGGQTLITVGGRNGLPEQQALTLARWIDWSLDNSAEFRQVFQEANVRFIVRDDSYLNRRNWSASPDTVAGNWGIIFHEHNGYRVESGLMGWNVQLIIHETSRIWNEQQQPGCGVNNQMTVEVETRLLQTFRNVLGAADWESANFILGLHQAQRDRPCARLG